METIFNDKHNSKILRIQRHSTSNLYPSIQTHCWEDKDQDKKMEENKNPNLKIKKKVQQKILNAVQKAN